MIKSLFNFNHWRKLYRQKAGKRLLALVFIMFVSLVVGFFSDFKYRHSPAHGVNVRKFQSHLIDKENEAALEVARLKKIIQHYSVDSITHLTFENKDISYYIYQNEQLVFWSDNNLDVSNIVIPDSSSWHLVQLPNAYCVSRLAYVENTRILALVKIKDNYPYENKQLVNAFATDFHVDNDVELLYGKSTDKNAVFCSHGDYLFTLSEPQTPIYNEMWSMVGLIAFILSFIIFFYLYSNAPRLFNRTTLQLQEFYLISVAVAIIMVVALYFNFPVIIFQNKLFSPFQYAANSLLGSISHLTVVTIYLFSTVYLFSNRVITSGYRFNARIILLFINILYFGLVYYFFSGLIFHSSIQLIILEVNDFSIFNVWVHFLILLWGISMAVLFYKTHMEMMRKCGIVRLIIWELVLVAAFLLCLLGWKTEEWLHITVTLLLLWVAFYVSVFLLVRKNKYVRMAFWLLIYTALIAWNASQINEDKKIEKYKVLSQNIAINGNNENDRMADILLEELDVQFSKDKKISQLIADSDSLVVANDYLNRNYLRGFWNKYEMRLNVVPKNSEAFNIYNLFITRSGIRIKSTHFYSVTDNESEMTYIGDFPGGCFKNDTVRLYMEFYPRRNFKSYSFPNLLIASSPDIQSHLGISVVKYDKHKQVFTNGKVEFEPTDHWVKKSKYDFYTMSSKNRTYYVYAPNKDSYIVVTEDKVHDPVSYWLYCLYTFLCYFCLYSLMFWLRSYVHRSGFFDIGLIARFQSAFIGLLMISFLLIFYVSVNFIQKRYEQEQISTLEKKKNYIQKALQEKYYWKQELTDQDTQSLNFDLQDLSYLYQTDINVYDNRGVLVGSSQPIIFNKNLTSNRISPKPFFTTKANTYQYEHIGKLNYLAAYTDFYNGDYLQIGYISVPQFFSREEIQKEIESFVAVIIHIYLIIILLTILFSLFIGRQLSAPLSMLEHKLRVMRIGRRNEKIEYNQNDEIGQLVIQYNRTIDELERSARLLAQSERETAWKSMARQVAHEINNPLTPMKLSIQQLQRTKALNDERFDDYFSKSTATLIEQIDNLSRIAGTFSDFARMPEAKFTRVDVASKLHSVTQLFANNNEQISIEYSGALRNVFVYADPEQLMQVFNNLLKNALQAIPENREGEIKVTLSVITNEVCMEFTDNGCGIQEDVLSKLFVPNFTTKTTGMGLGLAIAKNIIDQSSGRIDVNTTLNCGTTFTIWLPLELD